ncbi:MAG: hypothetical protein H0X62_08305 [Bacteroidetes bacterium]|nr:hypothetical protein [Bacteroidota bacterium]
MKNIYLKTIVIFALVAFFSEYGFAQTPSASSNNKAQEKIKNNENQKGVNETSREGESAKEGTYEFIRLKMNEGFTNQRMEEILVAIEEKRHLTDTVYYKISDFTTIKIYPME